MNSAWSQVKEASRAVFGYPPFQRGGGLRKLVLNRSSVVCIQLLYEVSSKVCYISAHSRSLQGDGLCCRQNN